MKKIFSFVICFIASFICSAQIVTTYFEPFPQNNYSGTSQGDGSVFGEVSLFNNPFGVATDLNGNVYVADSGNHTIRKISSDGVVTTLAGSNQGFANGTGNTAQFNNPRGITTDSNGNIYVADTGNHRIRKITPTGVVTTFAGSNQGYIDGIGTTAQFSDPSGIAFDSSGNLFVVDATIHNIRKITPDGVVNTFAGGFSSGSSDGITTEARFNYPTGIAIDAANNIYLADTNNHRIRKITPTGIVTTFAGFIQGNSDGSGTSAQFNEPTGVVLDANGNVYVADKGNHKIRKITSTGIVTTFAGRSTNGNVDGNNLGTEAYFFNPTGVAKDVNGNIYVADMSNSWIRKITPSGLVRRYAGGGYAGNVDGVAVRAGFFGFIGIAIDSNDNLYFSDSGHRIRRVTPNGYIKTIAGAYLGDAVYDYGSTNGPGISARFFAPQGMAVDASNNVYVADMKNYKIRKITPEGIVSTFAGSSQGYLDGTGTAAKFMSPNNITIDATNNIYVADADRIRKITPAGIVTSLVESNFGGLSGIALDSGGNVYVTSGYNKIFKITPSGFVTTFAGGGSDPVNPVAGYADGTGTSALFNSPRGLTIDAIGNLYVTDFFNDKIRKITPAGVVTTFAGSTRGYIDGTGIEAQFNTPTNVAINKNGNIYVLDWQGSFVRKITRSSLDVVENFLPKSKLILFPNPTNENLNVVYDNFSTIAKIRIKDIMGKEVFSKKIESSNTIISTSVFGKGIYFITIVDGEKKESQKFIVD